ncbi:hypothetical protein I7I50_05908 [Histoplasma capsulatum G186AR]|uniref:Uncharacterized protein n=1 Tax=Ajellomyces capsulatus TaxID=5037 RepID=A0A8H7ZD11_AJECA|nr:hypothetical protein I7I52_04167 [Histoplasma capsulatum]QSS76450.1 hypothetical protein I7I50_05908 [Histoplasma capsulatum G186AR]
MEACWGTFNYWQPTPPRSHQRSQPRPHPPLGAWPSVRFRRPAPNEKRKEAAGKAEKKQKKKAKAERRKNKT